MKLTVSGERDEITDKRGAFTVYEVSK